MFSWRNKTSIMPPKITTMLQSSILQPNILWVRIPGALRVFCVWSIPLKSDPDRVEPVSMRDASTDNGRTRCIYLPMCIYIYIYICSYACIIHIYHVYKYNICIYVLVLSVSPLPRGSALSKATLPFRV